MIKKRRRRYLNVHPLRFFSAAQLYHAVETFFRRRAGGLVQNNLFAAARTAIVHMKQRRQLHIVAHKIFAERIKPFLRTLELQVFRNRIFRGDDKFLCRALPREIHDSAGGAHVIRLFPYLGAALGMRDRKSVV